MDGQAIKRRTRLLRHAVMFTAVVLALLGGSLYWLTAALLWSSLIVTARIRTRLKVLAAVLPLGLMIGGLEAFGQDWHLNRAATVPMSARYVRCTQREHPPTDVERRTSCRELLVVGRLCEDGDGPVQNGPDFFMGSGGDECVSRREPSKGRVPDRH